MKRKATEMFIQGKPCSLKDMDPHSLPLTLEQKRIWEARMEGPTIWELSPDQQGVFADQVVLTMAAVCGCELPSTPILANCIAQEIENLLIKWGYSNLSTGEVLLAIRFNVEKRVKNPGGEDFDRVNPPERVSTAFLASLLANYSVLRATLDRAIENRLKGL